MNILMLCTKYPLDSGDSYMTTELAEALVRDGHKLSAVVVDWDAPYRSKARISTKNGVRVITIAPWAMTGLGRLIERVTKWTLSSVLAAAQMRRLLDGVKFDAILAFTPCTTVALQLAWAKRKFGARSMLFVYDFFPYHQQSIGLIPAGVIFAAARALENRLIRGFDIIGCNWPANIRYLQEHYSLRPQQSVVWTPLWTDITPLQAVDRHKVRSDHGLPVEKKIVVFGGQITEGRGVEVMLGAAQLARSQRPDLAFVFIGDGRLATQIQARAGEPSSNVLYLKRVPRESYLSLVAACDIGLVATVPGVDSSSFPTKTIDYLRAGLPIVAAVESASDYRAFLERWGIGISLPAGDAAALLSAICRQVDLQVAADVANARARRCLEEVFDVRRATQNVTDLLVRRI